MGAREAKLAVKGANNIQKTTLAMEKVVALLAKIKLPALVKLIPQRLSKLGKTTVFVMTFTVGTASAEPPWWRPLPSASGLT